jgi:thiamine pyrophosphate-dependent acetolactate synthase large subunit-like protein
MSVFLIFLFAFEMVSGQVNEPQPINQKQDMYDFYSLKHKRLKTTGFILLGAGVGLTVGGIAVAASSDSWDGAGSGAIMFIAGGLSTIASIPVFIFSGSNKRKAKTYLVGGTVSGRNITFNNTRFLSIGLKTNF